MGDVGQDAVEEIDFVPNRRGRGRAPRGGYNFGWSLFEGRSRYRARAAPGHLPPVITHSQGAGFCSIIGGYVIRDRWVAACAGATSTAITATRSCAWRGCAAAARRPVRSACAYPTSSPSARTAAAACTSSR